MKIILTNSFSDKLVRQLQYISLDKPLAAKKFRNALIKEIKEIKEFRFLGRIDNVINSAGLKIYPEQLESLVKKEISNEIIFLGLENELLGQKLILAIEGNEDENIKQHLSSIKYPSKNHQPKEIIFIEKLPRISNGKIDRRALIEIVSKR